MVEEKLEQQAQAFVDMEEKHQCMIRSINEMKKMIALLSESETATKENKMLQLPPTKMDEQLQELKLKESSCMEQFFAKLQSLGELKKLHIATDRLQKEEWEKTLKLQKKLEEANERKVNNDVEQLYTKNAVLQEVALKPIQTVGLS